MEKNQNIGQEFKSTENKKNIIFKKYLSVIWEFLKVIVIAAIIVLPIRYFLFQPFIVKGESMVPNLQSGDYLIIDEISYRFSNPKRGDIVVLGYPIDIRQRFIKRIIGVPGETVDIKNGNVTISNSQGTFSLSEKYLPDNLETEGNIHVVLGDEEYFVLGDNRQFSYDSRKWGVLPRKDIIGKAFFRLFPLSEMTHIKGWDY